MCGDVGPGKGVLARLSWSWNAREIDVEFVEGLYTPVDDIRLICSVTARLSRWPRRSCRRRDQVSGGGESIGGLKGREVEASEGMAEAHRPRWEVFLEKRRDSSEQEGRAEMQQGSPIDHICGDGIRR